MAQAHGPQPKQSGKMKIKNWCFNSKCPHHEELEAMFEIKDCDSFLRVKLSGGTIPFGEKFWEGRPVEIITVKDVPRFSNMRWVDWNAEDAKKVNAILGERVFTERG